MQSIEEFLSEFSFSDTSKTEAPKEMAVAFWLPEEVKARYDRLQERTGRRFSKKLKELLMAAIDHAEKLAG